VSFQKTAAVTAIAYYGFTGLSTVLLRSESAAVCGLMPHASVAIIGRISKLNRCFSLSLMKTRLAVILLALTAFGGATAQEAEKPPEFASFESGICIFKLQGCELTGPVERAIVFGVTRIFDTYKGGFGFDYPDDYKIKITIFADKDNFIAYQKKQGKKSLASSAYYSVRFREAVVYWRTSSKKTDDAKKMVGSVYHEASHMLLMTKVPRVPLWINEGLAEYFEGLNVFGDNRRVYLNKHSQRWLTRWAKKGFPIGFEEYLSLSHGEWYKFDEKIKGCNAAYITGYSLVYFMMSRSNTEIVLKELLWEFKRQGRKATSVNVVNMHYPGGCERFEQIWHKWILRAKSYRPLRALRTQVEKSKENTATKTSTSENETEDSEPPVSQSPKKNSPPQTTQK
jgi:hypothetical protein